MSVDNRRAITLAVVAAAALSGCGKGSPSTVAAVSGASSSPGARAQAVAYATAINLKASDLPGLQVKRGESEHAAITVTDIALARCVGEAKPVRLVNRTSPTFAAALNGENEQISSNVEVLPSAALAREHFIVQDRQRGLNCLKRTIVRGLAGQRDARVHFGPARVSRLPTPTGVPHSEAVRVSVPILGVPAQLGTNPTYYIDALVFISGASEIGLTATAFPRPVPSRAESSILALLYRRAAASKP